MTRLFGHTRRERTDADTENLDLLLRSGSIDQLMAGVYTYMPLGWRVKRKVEAIVREEMDAGAPSRSTCRRSSRSTSGSAPAAPTRWGPCSSRLNDQRDRALALGPTHEEVVTQLFATTRSRTAMCR